MRKLLFAAGLVGASVMSGCTLQKMVKMAKDQELTVTPNPLEVHADTVTYDMSAVLPVKMLRSDKVYTINNFYQYGDKEMEAGSVEFVANEYPDKDTQQPRESKTFSFPYMEGMDQGTLYVQGIAAEEKNPVKFRETERMPVAEGLITTSRLVKDVYVSTYAPSGYFSGEELIPTYVEFFFLQGSPVLRYSEKVSERGKEFSAFVAEKNVTRTVTIRGTHSPEGPERINSRLSEQRAKAIETFYRQQMRKYDYKGMADSIDFVLKPVIDDWTEFKAMLEDYDGVSSDEKSAILNIVNGRGTFEEKERMLEQRPSYRSIFKDIYPKLRNSKTEILTVKVKKTDAEIAVLSKQIAEGQISADELSNEELLYGATLTPSLKEKQAIYEASIKKEDNWVAHNNLAAVHLDMANQTGDMKHVDMALPHLDIARKQNPNAAEVKANTAEVLYLQGKDREALAMANQAAPGLTVGELEPFNGMKGALEIKAAKYDDAVRTLSNAEETADNGYNKGLAQVLAKDYNNAMVTEQEVTNANPDYAMAHYVAAIAAARTQNESGVYSHLSEAVAADRSLAGKALNDLEFRDYKDTDEFRNALK
ncbi:tetratricopeptide repeat protein [Xanthovirga aplysinae]|uniref:tetratricopeptide repeat protein n=1 Tax=Xanthovirga aplysinae TaxID=2529853 RepID=UPI0012BD48E3|nr:hypothetical protein [Xanthovirga aplysinae]MTI33537.1 hypothetical protein [Xanthovirga aplysinae]